MIKYYDSTYKGYHECFLTILERGSLVGLEKLLMGLISWDDSLLYYQNEGLSDKTASKSNMENKENDLNFVWWASKVLIYKLVGLQTFYLRNHSSTTNPSLLLIFVNWQFDAIKENGLTIHRNDVINCLTLCLLYHVKNRWCSETSYFSIIT